jgi:hypothetical protein
VVILYGAEGLASPAEADRFGYLIYQAGVLKTLYPGQRRSLRMHDARTPPTPELLRPDLFLVRLREDLSFEVAESVLPEGRR